MESRGYMVHLGRRETHKRALKWNYGSWRNSGLGRDFLFAGREGTDSGRGGSVSWIQRTWRDFLWTFSGLRRTWRDFLWSLKDLGRLSLDLEGLGRFSLDFEGLRETFSGLGRFWEDFLWTSKDLGRLSLDLEGLSIPLSLPLGLSIFLSSFSRLSFSLPQFI